MASSDRYLRYLLILLALVGVLAIQSAVLVHLPVAGARPQLPLVVVMVMGLLRGPETGLSLGLCMGLLVDLHGGRLTGSHTVFLGLAGLAAGWLSIKLFSDSVLVPAVIVGLGSLVYEAAYLLVMNAFGFGFPWQTAGVRVILPTGLYNLALTLVVYPLCLRWFGRSREEAPSFPLF